VIEHSRPGGIFLVLQNKGFKKGIAVFRRRSLISSSSMRSVSKNGKNHWLSKK
jgi:hypothetical protein